jgi:hypothetical protein
LQYLLRLNLIRRICSGDGAGGGEGETGNHQNESEQEGGGNLETLFKVGGDLKLSPDLPPSCGLLAVSPWSSPPPSGVAVPIGRAAAAAAREESLAS